MRRSLLSAGALATFALASAPALRAQQANAAAVSAAPTVLRVGDVAPDFTLPAVTRFGVLREPLRLSDYRGKTVVLAFFFKARTKG